MATLNLTLDPESLREATSQAILGVLTPEMKASLIRQAIDAIIKPVTNSYGSTARKSSLEEAFEIAVNRIVREVAEEMVQQDESLRSKIRELLASTAEIMFTNYDQTKLVERMAEAFITSCRRD